MGKRLRAAILALAARRGPQSSICPSDAARAIGGENWRETMTDANAVARDLAKSGDVKITQRGSILDPEETWRGPIRITIADIAQT
ncbi:S-adenosylmethionine tRNA ribosyltransferase [Mycobacterium asiaticum]|uniref:S-adenosylmethionine tRNA ribosyltransferase n=1 Tax=Mycobacterium asiaticum TaxID=1790 RepID=A0A1A3PBT8_MYCAS|nr:S-adenosylmethionine tRNA ribosyltransferase [Mycobacterium asiaticum]